VHPSSAGILPNFKVILGKLQLHLNLFQVIHRKKYFCLSSLMTKVLRFASTRGCTPFREGGRGTSLGEAADAIRLVVGTMTFCPRNCALTHKHGNDEMSSNGGRNERATEMCSRREKNFRANLCFKITC
jgi:hypothetical protein